MKSIMLSLLLLTTATTAASALTFDSAENARQNKLWLEKKDPLSLEINRESRAQFDRDQQVIENRRQYNEQRKNDPKIFCIEIAILYTEIKLGYMDTETYNDYHRQCVSQFKGK